MFSLLWVACSESLDQNTTSLQDHRAACYSDMIFFSRLFNPRSQSSYKALNLWYTAFEDYCIESRTGQRILHRKGFHWQTSWKTEFFGVFLGGIYYWGLIFLTSKIPINVISLRFGHWANNSFWKGVISMTKQIKGIAGDLVHENK